MEDRHNVSKSLEVLVACEMAELHPSSSHPRTFNTVNPGMYRSELGREAAFDQVFMRGWLPRTEVGNRTIVHASWAGWESHDGYLDDCMFKEPSPFVLSVEGGWHRREFGMS